MNSPSRHPIAHGQWGPANTIPLGMYYPDLPPEDASEPEYLQDLAFKTTPGSAFAETITDADYRPLPC